ncbi:MAG: class I SAM-dependent methyltransferase [Pseudomonadales bacterium]
MIDLSSAKQWYQTALGQRVLGTEKALHDELLEDLFGYHLLQLGTGETPLFNQSPIQNCNRMTFGGGVHGDLVGSPMQIPFAQDQIDVMLVHHLLEYVDRPQAILAECARVVMPMGVMIVTLFNPLSLWGLRQKVVGRPAGYPFEGEFFTAYRVMDWLNVLNFKIDRVLFAEFGFPWAFRSLTPPKFGLGLGRRYNLPLGGVYMLVARKYVGPLTPAASLLRRRSRRFSGIGMAEPVTSQRPQASSSRL